TSLSTSKLDGNTYTNFLSNDYKTTAERATSAFTKVNKVIDANGNSTDAFAKAVYDKNATRQSADFKEVTKDLVKTATYTAGINGVKNSISSVRGDLDKLSVGGRNLIDYSMITKNTGNLDKSGYVKKGLITFGVTNTYDGVKVDASKLEPNTEYVMSYKYKKTSGTLVAFGGHTTPTFDNNLAYVDGSTEGSLYSGNTSVFVKDDNEVHSVVVKFTTPQTITSSDPIYIQPNRGQSKAVTVNIYDWKLEKGTIPTDWSPAPEDMLGKADFQVFKNTYESNDQTIKSRLTAIDSGAKGSVIYNANTALSTAQGNTRSITSLNTKVDGLKIGGRNLISGTDDLTNIFGSGYGGSSIKYHKDYEVSDAEWGKTTKATRVVITKASGTSGVFTTANHFRMIFGKPYTLSFYVKNLGQNRIQFNLNGLTLNPDGTGSQSIYVNGGESGKFSATGYMRNNPEWNWFQILPTPASGVTSMDFAIAYLQVEEGNFATDLTPALSDQMGKAEFTLFKNEYEDTSSKILSRLTAIDSSKEGSVVTRLNKTEKTASGNSTLISTINKNYV